MATELTISKIRRALDIIRDGYSANCAYKSIGLSASTVSLACIDHPEIRKELEKAKGECSIKLQTKALQSTAGAIFLLSRMFPKEFGKHKEEEMELNLSEEAKSILLSRTSSGEEKAKAISNDFYTGRITLPLFEKLISVLKMSHPDLSKSEVGGHISISEALIPDK